MLQSRTLYIGDNIDFLKGMDSESVHLIATDPPFRKGRDFEGDAGAFTDRWDWHGGNFNDWLYEIAEHWPGLAAYIRAVRITHSDSMAAYLCWIGVRLMEMHRILRLDGSIYLHLDFTAVSYVRAVMDAIFGKRNFRNEIAWCYRGMPSKANRWQQKHDNILFYSKSDDYTFHVLKGIPAESSLKTFKSAKKRGYNANIKRKMVTVFDWDKYNEAVRSGKLPTGLRETEFTDGKPPMRSWWDDIPIARGKECINYPTQKPIKLYERIIKASSNKGDMVLDPFCGSGTTVIAAHKLGRDWIGIDKYAKEVDLVLDRFDQHGLVVPFRTPGMRPARYLMKEDIHISETPPKRKDKKVYPPTGLLELRIQRRPHNWERLNDDEMRELLFYGQGQSCGGLRYPTPY